MSRIPVDKSKAGDAHYRYFMDAIQTKVEGSGNGIKTVIVNAEKVSATLERKVQYLMKYLAVELGATDKLKDEKHILTGRHERDDVQAKVYGFIDHFILCRRCRNPETVIYVDTDHRVMMRCVACGVENQLLGASSTEAKLVNVIMKMEVPRVMEKVRQRKTKRTDAEKDTAEWAAMIGDGVDTSGFHESENPVVRLRREIDELEKQTGTPCNANEIYSMAVNIRTEYSLSDYNLVQLVFEGVFDKDIIKGKQIETYGRLLTRVIRDDDKARRVLIEELVAFLEQQKTSDDADAANLHKKFPVLLLALMDAKVISSEFILQWVKEPPRRSFAIRPQLEARVKAQPLVDVLAGDSDDEDEEDEDEDEDEDESEEGSDMGSDEDED